MTINTKFNIGDPIAFIDTKSMTLHEDKVKSIAAYSTDGGYEVWYNTGKSHCVSEENVRCSREEILESLNRPF